MFARLRSLWPAAVAGLTLLFAACSGYTVGNSPPSAFIGITTIAVPTAENRTLEPRLAPLVTSQVVSSLSSDGTFQMGQVDSADAVLELKVKNVNRQSLRSARTSIFRSRELGIQLEIEYILRRNDEEGAILRTGTVIGDTTVFPRGNYQVAERDALQTAARRGADELTAVLCNGW